MKWVIHAIFLLIIIQHVSAEIYEEQIFNEKLTASGTYTTSNGENFTIALLGDYINIKLKSNSMIVKNNTCETSGIYDVCLLITEFSHYNYTEPEKIVNKRDVTITTRVAKLNLTREIEKTEFWIGDETEVRMRIQNIGSRPATVSFIDNFSDSFKAQIPLNCDLKEDAVVWKGELDTNQVITCSYRIKAATAGEFSSSATAAYNNGVSDETETDSITFTVKDFPLQLSSNTSSQGIKLGSEVVAHFDINATENMTVKSLKMLLPNGFRLLGWNGINKIGDGTLEYEGILYAGDGHEFTITFAAEKTGIFVIQEITKLVLTSNRTSQSFEREIELNVSVDKLYTRIVKSNFSSGTNTLNIFVVNPSSLDFYNVELNIGTSLPLAKKEAAFSKVSLLGHQEFSEEFEAYAGTYPIKTTLTYSSLYGEIFSVEKDENVTIYGEARGNAIQETPKDGNVQEEVKQEEPPTEEPNAKEGKKTELKIPKSKFSAKAAIFATAIVVIAAGILVFISTRRKKYEDDEF